MRPKQKGPAVRGGTGPARKLGETRSYRIRAASVAQEILPPGARLGRHWLACGDRCISAVYRFYTDDPGPAIQSIVQAAVDDDLTIEPDLFGSQTQGNLLRIIVGCRMSGLPVTFGNILALATHLGWPIVDDGGDEAACLRRVLECESSASGLTTWPVRLRDCVLRRRMTWDLNATFARSLDPHDPVADIIEECAANIDAWRKFESAVRHG